jgi:hypothetical protein
MIEEGTKKGEIRFAPFSLKSSAVFSMVPKPPIPAPMENQVLILLPILKPKDNLLPLVVRLKILILPII